MFLVPVCHGADVVFTDGHFLAIYQSFWNHGEDLFVRHRVQIPNSLSSEQENNLEMLELAVIDLPEGSQKAFTTAVSKLLVTPIYDTFWDILNHEAQCWQDLDPQSEKFSHLCHATIVTGQPGIGQYIIIAIFYNFDLLDLIH